MRLGKSRAWVFWFWISFHFGSSRRVMNDMKLIKPCGSKFCVSV